jgi:hypothetical protein
MAAAVTTTAVLVSVGCTLAVSNRAERPAHAWESTAPCSTPAPPEGVTTPATHAPDGGGLRVVDKGFTQIDGPRGFQVSLGAVLENTSTQLAYRSRVTLRIYDSEHHPAEWDDRPGEVLMIPVLRPGERVGVGAGTSARNSTIQASNGRLLDGPPVTVAALEVQLGEAQWLPPDDNVFARISARHERTEPERISDKDATVRYVIGSGYCRPISGHGIGIVFRDKAGAIVGGDVDGNMAPCRPGSETESAIAFQSFPPNAALTRTEVYPYCDPFPIGDAPGLGPRAADAPWNYRSLN